MDNTFRPTKKTVLIGMLTDRQAQEEVHNYCKQRWEPYPHGGDTYFCWKTCLLAGIGIPYTDRVQSTMYLMLEIGWEQIGVDQIPEPGDIVIFRKSRFDMGMEFVSKNIDKNSYIGVGCEGKGKRIRKKLEDLSFPEDRCVTIFLRYNCRECSQRRLANAQNT